MNFFSSHPEITSVEFRLFAGSSPSGIVPKLFSVNNTSCAYPSSFTLNREGILDENNLLTEERSFLVEVNLTHQEIEELLIFTQQFFFDHIMGKHRTLMGKSLVLKRNGEAELHLSPLVPPLILPWESK